MSDALTINRRFDSLDVSPQFQAYSKVIIHIDEETSVEAGNDTGRVLEFTNPFGTQAMAQAVLDSLSGFKYQPYTAVGAILDPAAEIGDGVNMSATYGGIYTRKRKFTSLMKADISAPQDEEVDHEFPFESPQERNFTRQVDEVKASLLIQSDRIDATVSKEGGTSSSFGWSLQSNAHTWYANGQEVMKITASGLFVKGRVEASEGKIGNFNISASAIWNGIKSFGATSPSRGVYIGTDGIQLGQAFKVNSSGAVTATNITANNMVLTGTLKIGGTNITAEALRSGAQSAYSNGSRWSTGSGYGYNYNNATKESGGTYPNFFRANGIVAARSFSCYGSTMLLGSYSAKWMSKTIAGVTIRYLGRD